MQLDFLFKEWGAKINLGGAKHIINCIMVFQIQGGGKSPPLLPLPKCNPEYSTYVVASFPTAAA